MQRIVRFASMVISVGGISFMCSCPPGSAIRPAEHNYSQDNMPPVGLVIKSVSVEKTGSLVDPLSPQWGTAEATEIPLYAQDVMAPRGGGSTSNVTVKAVNTARGILLHLEWDDSTLDDSTSSSTFKDGAAVQFPAGDSRSKNLAMGHAQNPVSIWHWSAGPVADSGQSGTMNDRRSARSPRRPPVKVNGVAIGGGFRELTATGVYTQQMKPSDFQRLFGTARWKDGRWHLTMYRPIGSRDDVTADFARASVPIAFAIWNGSAGERLSIKSVSNWASLNLR